MFGSSRPKRKQGKQIVTARANSSNFSLGQEYVPVHEYEVRRHILLLFNTDFPGEFSSAVFFSLPIRLAWKDAEIKSDLMFRFFFFFSLLITSAVFCANYLPPFSCLGKSIFLLSGFFVFYYPRAWLQCRAGTI
jgi:hypothetical protein